MGAVDQDSRKRTANTSWPVPGARRRRHGRAQVRFEARQDEGELELENEQMLSIKSEAVSSVMRPVLEKWLPRTKSKEGKGKRTMGSPRRSWRGSRRSEMTWGGRKRRRRAVAGGQRRRPCRRCGAPRPNSSRGKDEDSGALPSPLSAGGCMARGGSAMARLQRHQSLAEKQWKTGGERKGASGGS